MCLDDYNDGFYTEVENRKINTEVVNKNDTSVEVYSSKPVELNSVSNAKLTDRVNFKGASVQSPSKTVFADETVKYMKNTLSFYERNFTILKDYIAVEFDQLKIVRDVLTKTN